jgi:hypothetical protein
MVPRHLLQDGLLFLLCLFLLLVVVILGVAWKGRTPVPVVSVPVEVIVREGLIVVIAIVMPIVMLVGSTAGPLVPWRCSVPTCQSCPFHIEDHCIGSVGGVSDRALLFSRFSRSRVH